jgi:hypothetical protein
MLEFPRLKTGVAVQYPVEYAADSPVRAFTFLDGTQQRFVRKRIRRRWIVRLDQLDEGEAARLEEFAKRHFQTLEPFEFVDPRTGVAYSPCLLEGGEQHVQALGPGRSGATLVIVEWSR